MKSFIERDDFNKVSFFVYIYATWWLDLKDLDELFYYGIFHAIRSVNMEHMKNVIELI